MCTFQGNKLAVALDSLKTFSKPLHWPAAAIKCDRRQAARLTDGGGSTKLDQQGECSSHKLPIKLAGRSHSRSSQNEASLSDEINLHAISLHTDSCPLRCLTTANNPPPRSASGQQPGGLVKEREAPWSAEGVCAASRLAFGCDLRQPIEALQREE